MKIEPMRPEDYAERATWRYGPPYGFYDETDEPAGATNTGFSNVCRAGGNAPTKEGATVRSAALKSMPPKPFT